MKKVIALLLLISFAFASCGPKPQYKTRKGKKKQKYYNSIQYQMTHLKTENREVLLVVNL